MKESYLIHLVSDSTCETLGMAARAAAEFYPHRQADPRYHVLVRSSRRLESVKSLIAADPGIVLFTLTDRALRTDLESHCRRLGVPCLAILDPLIDSLGAHLGESSTLPHIGAQHAMNREYFRRIDALNYGMSHDDGGGSETLEDADVILVGVSRTSKTPTSIYLANRGVRAANVPLVPGIPPPESLLRAERPLVVGLVAGVERLAELRMNRVRDGLAPNGAAGRNWDYVEERAIAEEIRAARALFERLGWPTIDVTRRSIEETSALVMSLLTERRRARDEHGGAT